MRGNVLQTIGRSRDKSDNVLVVWKFCMHPCTGPANLNEVRISSNNLRMNFACIFAKDQTDVTRIRRSHDQLRGPCKQVSDDQCLVRA